MQWPRLPMLCAELQCLEQNTLEEGEDPSTGIFKALPRNSSVSKFNNGFSNEKHCVSWGTFKGLCQGIVCVMLGDPLLREVHDLLWVHHKLGGSPKAWIEAPRPSLLLLLCLAAGGRSRS